MQLDVLLEDGPCLVVNKPAGILTQGPPAAVDTLSQRVRAYLKQRYDKPGNVYLGIPHRLDRAVSGTVVFAKNSKAARRLAEQFRDRQVQKTYWALLENVPKDKEGTLCHWLDKHPDAPMARVVSSSSPTAKEALLRYKVLEELQGRALVEVLLVTGRFHQIRVQFAAIGCPIMGDRLYGSPASLDSSDSKVSDDPFWEPPIALHARKLRFLHPIRYDIIEVTAPLPSYWPSNASV